jgi:hypothetical protein
VVTVGAPVCEATGGAIMCEATGGATMFESAANVRVGVCVEAEVSKSLVCH